MKFRAVIIATILLIASSVTAGELRFIQDSSGLTSHVMYNGQLHPVASDGTVILDGSKIPVTVLMAAAQPQQPTMQPPQQWQNPDLQQPQVKTSNQSKPSKEYKNTRSATQREIKRETRKIFGNGTGSSIGSGVVEDVLGSFF